MFRRLVKSIIATGSAAFMMWVIAGLWHNLILPTIDSSVRPHHEGIVFMLGAYTILAGLMTHLYTQSKKNSLLLAGLRLGVIAGILWVFPHGLAMAAAHGSPILYEVKNALWHVLEQGLGGVMIAMIKGDEPFA